MSYQVGSLLHEFQCYSKRLQFGINKGLEIYLATIKFKK